MNEIPRTPPRSPESWAPFMEGLRTEVRRRRTARSLRAAAALALAGLLACAVALALRREREKPALLAATIPTTLRPLFESETGTVEAAGEHAVVVLGADAP